jgi:hypothetical protein
VQVICEERIAALERAPPLWNGEEWTMFVSDHNRVSLFTLKFQTGDASANT